ncbi:MAG: Integral membrane sensor signal transduction histidine kinase [Synergistales bacterium 53_16]|nr:MAG: Integral membrane sensor signal transduction histidine kinase [Synergistales bacterium 53_16]KUL05123.1 MAG: Integral membrane sensor signal transduction histidine kinase [Synergistales bacterium 54_9]MDK2846126.1 hypothetical protein [Synergistales bacterium]MDN5336003.1 hypothetical protein [Synergistales bacterium]HAG21836.1 hypothetical protein [Synergistaceae bacterium]
MSKDGRKGAAAFRKERRWSPLRSFRFRMLFFTSLSVFAVVFIFSMAIFFFFTWTEMEQLDKEQNHKLVFFAEQIAKSGHFYLDGPEYEKLQKTIKRRNADLQIYSSDLRFFDDVSWAVNGISPLPQTLLRSIIEKGPAKQSTIDLSSMEILPETLWLWPFSPKADRVILRVAWKLLNLEDGEYYLLLLVPLDALLASRSTLLKTILMMMGVAALLSAGVGYLTNKRNTRRFELINKAISKVSVDNMKLDISINDANEEIRETVLLINRMLEDLSKSIRQLQQFTADASHELRTPLAVMKGIVEVTLLKDRGKEYYVGKLQELAFQIEAMQALVSALLELARLDAFERLEHKDPVELLMVADEAATIAEPLIRQKGQHFEKELSPAATRGWETLLTRLVSNLIDNAAKYTPEGGKITIRTYTDVIRKEAVLEVADTGKGMTEDEITHCFERFWRAESSRTTAGYGLGLSLVLRIAELHEGRLEIKSRPGRGTLFRVRFRLDEEVLGTYEEA